MADLRFFVTQEGPQPRGPEMTLCSTTQVFSQIPSRVSAVRPHLPREPDDFDLCSCISLAGGSAGINSAGALNAVYHGTYVSGTFRVVPNCWNHCCFRSYWYLQVSATVDTLQNSGLATLRGGVIGGNTGNDSIYLGDQPPSSAPLLSVVVQVMTSWYFQLRRKYRR